MLRQFLSVADANRALRTLRRLGHHDIRGWALTGGLAVEVHCLLRGGWPSLRALNDIDFIAESFGSILETLDHRKPAHPLTFKEAIDLLRDLIPARHDLLIAPEYSKDAEDVCLRCRNIRALRLADPKIILSILGYC